MNISREFQGTALLVNILMESAGNRARVLWCSIVRIEKGGIGGSNELLLNRHSEV